MNRPILLIGFVVVLAMCLVPPWNVYERNTEAYRGVKYRPAWAESGWIEVSAPNEIDRMRGEVNTERLMLQVLVAAMVCGTGAYVIGLRRREKGERRA